jgi:hypothetical protein
MSANSKFEGDDIPKNDPNFQPPRFEQYREAVRLLDVFAQERWSGIIMARTSSICPRPKR